MINWRKSSRSGGGNDDACVELAESGGRLWVRDSKDPEGLGWFSCGSRSPVCWSG